VNKPDASRTILLLDPSNDGRHALRDLPLERESIPYVISLPEHGIGTFVYTWVTKDSSAGALFVVFGPTVGEQPIVEAVDNIAVPKTMNFDDWRVGRFYLKQDLNLKQAEIQFAGERVALDVRFDSLHPAYAYGFHRDGCPPYLATNRFEQAGRARGSVSVAGRKFDFDTTAARDHSWGTRDWDMAQHWKWLHAQAGPELSVHFMETRARGRTDLRGYVYRDRQMAEVTSVEVDFENDAAYRQTHITASVHDAAGRTTRVTGDYFAHFPLVPVPSCTLVEGAMRCEIEGQAGTGWTEFMWPTAYLEHLRTHPL
jgi:hypothetical protein